MSKPIPVEVGFTFYYTDKRLKYTSKDFGIKSIPYGEGDDECDMDWEWRCSNCNVNLSERYDDLDINTFEELGLSYCPNCRCRIINTDM